MTGNIAIPQGAWVRVPQSTLVFPSVLSASVTSYALVINQITTFARRGAAWVRLPDTPAPRSVLNASPSSVITRMTLSGDQLGVVYNNPGTYGALFMRALHL